VESRAKRLERAATRNRLKRKVAHGARFGAQAEKRLDRQSDRVVTAAEGRPRTYSGTFPSQHLAVAKLRTWAERKAGGIFAAPSAIMRELFALAWPIAAAMLGETAIGLVDTKLVGGLGAAALGGVGLATTIMFLCYALAFGAMRGVKVRASHAIGEGNPHHAFAYARAGLVIGGAFGVAVLVACRDVAPVLHWLGADPAIVPHARDFLAAVTLGAPATCAMAALIQHRQATGDSRTPMIVGIAGNSFNALLGWALIYGRFGLPALGVRGAGYATTVTETLELATMVVLVLRDERSASSASGTSHEPRSAKGSAEGGCDAPPSLGQALRAVTELGIPTGIQFTSEALAFTVFTVVLSSISKEEIAANQVALNVIRVSFLPGVAVSEAASVLVGRALGRRRISEADAVVRSALVLAVGFMATCGVVFGLAGGPLGHFFSSDPIVIAAARKLLLVAAVFQVLDAVNIVFRCALRGAKDVRVVAAIGVLVVWSFLPTSAWVLGKHYGLGALGAWLGFVGETTIGALLFSLRWKRGGWRRTYAATITEV
jgi:MATE family multidrug resistance protein